MHGVFARLSRGIFQRGSLPRQIANYILNTCKGISVGNLVIYNKYSFLRGVVEIDSTDFTTNRYSVTRELLRKYQCNPAVMLKVNDEYKQAGNIASVYGNEITIELLDNSYGSFVQHMLYRAVDYKLVASVLGQVTSDNKLACIKITRLVITQYTKWF